MAVHHPGENERWLANRLQVLSEVSLRHGLDAIVFTGVIGNLIVFLLAKTTKLDPLRVALWTFLVVNLVPAIVLAIVGGRIDPHFNTTATLGGYAGSFLFWFGIHWIWSQTKGRMQPAN